MPATLPRPDGEISISPDEFERQMAGHVPRPTQGATTTTITPLDDCVFEKIAKLLEQSSKPAWSLRPRTYALLRMIGKLDAMDVFVSEGLHDISLPYSPKTLPDTLRSPTTRTMLLKFQPLVLSDRYFLQDGDKWYRPIKDLGSGGFGMVDHVWSAHDRGYFARKRMPRGKTFNKDRKLMADFENELEILKKLSHLHLVKYISSYTDPLYVGLIMSPVADSNLAEFLKTDPFPTAQRSCLQSFYGCLSAALLYLHENRIRHKDIKPQNILVHDNNVLITDFGTSLDWSDQDGSTTADAPRAITPKYCAPEVAAWEPRNTFSDIYSLGCVFMEIATILRGKSLGDMEGFFKSCGTGSNNIRMNPEAAEWWLEELRCSPNPGRDNEPLKWIVDMTAEAPRNRPSAQELITRIHEYKNGFCGACCAAVDENHRRTPRQEVAEARIIVEKPHNESPRLLAEIGKCAWVEDDYACVICNSNNHRSREHQLFPPEQQEPSPPPPSREPPPPPPKQELTLRPDARAPAQGLSRPGTFWTGLKPHDTGIHGLGPLTGGASFRRVTTSSESRRSSSSSDRPKTKPKRPLTGFGTSSTVLAHQSSPFIGRKLASGTK